MNNTKIKTKGKTLSQRAPRKVTKDGLRKIALHHLERYASSVQNLERVLRRRALNAARHHDTDMIKAQAWIGEIIDALVRSGIVDDKRYADGKAISMVRRGQSSFKVRAYLASKGVENGAITNALSYAETTLGKPDQIAAKAYAKRRHFGPFRLGEGSVNVRQKEMAAFSRAGFGYEIANQIVNANDESELDE
ncbi:MAG: regulatory protein RecX [Rhodospirillaceae bacterium]